MNIQSIKTNKISLKNPRKMNKYNKERKKNNNSK